MAGSRSLVALALVLLGCGARPSASGLDEAETGESSEGETGSPPRVDQQLPGFGASVVLVEDLDGDGHLDLAGIRSSKQLEIAWGDGEGGFVVELGPVFSPTQVGISRLLAGDVDGDGRRDLVLYHHMYDDAQADSSPAATVRRQAAPRVFGPAQVSEFGGDWVAWQDLPALLRDLDGDGDADLLVADTLYPDPDPDLINNAAAMSDGAGGFGPLLPSGLGVWCFTIDVEAGDFDGDGRDEYVWVGPWTCNGAHDPSPLYLVELDASGEATVRAELEVGYDPSQALIADFDGDGALDLVVRNQLDFSPFRGLGDGSFEARPRVALEPHVDGFASYYQLLSAELDGDDRAELLLVTRGLRADAWTTWRIDAPLDAPTFELIAELRVSAVGDFDEDGCDDLLYRELSDEPGVYHWSMRRCDAG